VEKTIVTEELAPFGSRIIEDGVHLDAIGVSLLVSGNRMLTDLARGDVWLLCADLYTRRDNLQFEQKHKDIKVSR
jgi:hypothetical protein